MIPSFPRVQLADQLTGRRYRPDLFAPGRIPHGVKGIRQHIAQETDTIQARRDLSVSCNNLGGISKAEGDLRQAKEWYEKAYEIRQHIARETNQIEDYENLAYTNSAILFNLTHLLGNDEIFKYVFDLYKVSKLLANVTNSPKYQKLFETATELFNSIKILTSGK